MDKRTFCKRYMLWTAIIVAAIILICGLCFGKVIEESLFAEIAKWIVVGLGIIAIFETFAYILSPWFWHMFHDGKGNDPESLD